MHFDATERRRSRMKENAAKPTVSQSYSPGFSQAASPVDQQVIDHKPATISEKENQETVGGASSYSLDDLSTFLINFVVEQTGYPADIVELDADLEADLGIDSIKKAQLFGEIGEYFSIPPRAAYTLSFSLSRLVTNLPPPPSLLHSHSLTHSLSHTLA